MTRPKWIPRSEDELETAAAAGLLDENTTKLEFKQEVANTDFGRRRLAEELASLSVDGGVLVVGIVDVKHRADRLAPSDALVPVSIDGEPERIEQIALMRCDPPLFVRTTPIASSEDPKRGYLVVDVPPSAQAPHMVDGRYWGRGDTTKRVLTNDEVVRLHEQQRLRNRDAEQELDACIERDPWLLSGILQSHGHLFVVAEPRGVRPNALLDLAPNQGWQRWLLDLVHLRANDSPRFGAFSPDLDAATKAERRSNGWATTCYYLENRTVVDGAGESDLIELEVTADGGLRLYCARATDLLASGTEVAFELLIAMLSYRVLRLAGDVANLIGFEGEWALGLALTGMRGSVSYLQTARHSMSEFEFSEDEFRSLERCSTAQLQGDALGANYRLTRRVLHAFGTEAHPDVLQFAQPRGASS